MTTNGQEFKLTPTMRKNGLAPAPSKQAGTVELGEKAVFDFRVTPAKQPPPHVQLPKQ